MLDPITLDQLRMFATVVETGSFSAAADRLKGSRTVKIYPAMPWAFQTIIVNASQGVTANVKVRQAIQAILVAFCFTRPLVSMLGKGTFFTTGPMGIGHNSSERF